VPSRPPPEEEAARAGAAARRLDDTFRGYLAERGSKPAPLAEVTGLLNGVAGLRLAGDAVLDVWQQDDGAGGDRTAARRELEAATELITAWYDGFSVGITTGGEIPEPMAPDANADARLVDAVSQDLRSQDGRATATAVRMIWTRDHLDAARRLQATLVEPATTAGSALTPTPLHGPSHWPRLPARTRRRGPAPAPHQAAADGSPTAATRSAAPLVPTETD
jgi:hypothetical protein